MTFQAPAIQKVTSTVQVAGHSLRAKNTNTKPAENEKIAIHKTTTTNSKINNEHKEATMQKENNIIDKHAEAIVQQETNTKNEPPEQEIVHDDTAVVSATTTVQAKDK